jgi:hypothetical protein
MVEMGGIETPSVGLAEVSVYSIVQKSCEKKFKN